ncbi:MAG: signal peptidase I [Spirochaetales bacterium]|nr:signal peptidase I [Spirochaetales bacterium]
MERFFEKVQERTENYLTRRKARKKAEKMNRTFLSEALGWLDAILFAVVVIFLVNQFLFQFFIIPSPSMLETLLVKDRVMVSKLTYGIEVFPQGPKILDSRTPDRNEIITFYNPQYESKGAFFNIISTLIYMVTFSLVNIDVDEQGNMREKLLVKRAAAVAGDTVTFIDGNAYIKLSGTGEYVDESLFREQNGMVTAPHRTIKDETYVWYNAMGRLNGLAEEGVTSGNLPRHLVTDYQAMDNSETFTDLYGYNKQTAIGSMMADPTDMEARSTWAKYDIGVYVPEGHVLPLGDNRDNSQDGRYFGPVNADDVNGKVVFRIWPIGRIGGLVNK